MVITRRPDRAGAVPVLPPRADVEVRPSGTVTVAAPPGVDVAVGMVALAADGLRAAAAVTSHVPVPSVVRTLGRRAWVAAAARGRAERATATERLLALADVLLPGLVRALLARVDVAALIREFVDLDAVAAGVDVDAVVARADLDAAVSRVDLDAIVERVDLDAVVDRLDLDGIVRRVDLQSIVDRLDLDAIIDRADLDRAAARLELDPIIERLDLLGLAQYVVEGIGLPDLIRSSTSTLGTEMVHGVRVRGADADQAVERMVDRLLMRRRARRTEVGENPPTPPGREDGARDHR